MLHVATPAAVVVAVQLWTVFPLPRFRTTVWPLSGVPLLVKVDDSVTDEALVAVVAPV